MRTLLAALLLLAAPGAASAGPALGLRVGYEWSGGDIASGTSMSELAKGQLPIQLDALWRFGPSFSMGGYYSFGFGRLSSDVASGCDALGADCSAWTMRAGIEAQYAFTDVAPSWAPWVGAGIGYEWAYAKLTSAGQTSRQDLSGWELLSLEGGADFKVATSLLVGPYLSLHLGEYSKLDGFSLPSKAFHQWFGLGVRGTWDF